MLKHCKSDPGRAPRTVNGSKLENAGLDREQERVRKKHNKPKPKPKPKKVIQFVLVEMNDIFQSSHKKKRRKKKGLDELKATSLLLSIF